MKKEKRKDTPHVSFAPRRNRGFDSAAATSNPQSQQMISLACIADSPTHIFIGERGCTKEEGGWGLRLGWEIGNAPNTMRECCVMERAAANWDWCSGAMWDRAVLGVPHRSNLQIFTFS